jgi:N-acetylglucosaminyldiphosphoundecaprenol N-acetyl-beta-D-mannosaminyltransferase
MSSSKEQSRELVRVVSLDTDVLDHDSAVERVAELVRKGDGGYVCFSTVHMVMEAHDSPDFAAKVNGADVIVPDGMPIVWMQKLTGDRSPTRVRANDLMMLLCRHAGVNGLKVGFYGGTQSVIDAIVERAQRDFPDLKIVYAFSPPFRPLTWEENEKITSEINRAAPDILFMGLGCPKQENWMAEHRDKVTAVMLGVGASFDFFAGNVKESPDWMGRLGLEWLYRLTQEPRRLWRRYLILNPRFMALALRQLFSQRSKGT